MEIITNRTQWESDKKKTHERNTKQKDVLDAKAEKHLKQKEVLEKYFKERPKYKTELIHELMILNNINSLDELSEHVLVDKGAISKWSRNHRTPNCESCIDLALALGLPNDLVGLFVIIFHPDLGKYLQPTKNPQK